MDDHRGKINQHYGNGNLSQRIKQALVDEGKDQNALTVEDLATFDQLHAGGAEATRQLAETAEIQAGSEVLEVGCGVGGPARTLASDFDCRVVGIDLTQEYIDAAVMLTDWVGLSNQIRFRQGDASALDFDDESFDVAWSQNVFMNIEDKAAVVSEVYRILRPGGIFALATLLAGPQDGLQYPVFWAERPEISFLIPPEAFRGIFFEIGFEEITWHDATQESLDAGRARLDRLEEEGPGLGTEVLMDDVPIKGQHTDQGLARGQLINVYGVYKRPA